MASEHNDGIVKTEDTLIVLHHGSSTVGIVGGVDSSGELIEASQGVNDVQAGVRISDVEKTFPEFYLDFYKQLKNPEEFSFFKVRVYEAAEVADQLQSYVDGATDAELDVLKEHEITIDAVQKRVVVNTELKGPYRFTVDQVDKEMLEKIGLSVEKLEQLNVMDGLLKGYKTPSLIPVEIDLGTAKITTDVRLRFIESNVGKLNIHMHPVRKTVDFSRKLYGHEFTEEDKINLLETGNMGRVVELVNPMTGEIIPSVISRDRLTNELVTFRAGSIRVPLVLSGVTLDEGQKKILREGKVLFVENMISKKGRLFHANVQFNADKGYVEYLFGRKVKRLEIGDIGRKVGRDVPDVFRGKVLKKWQKEKLKAGEVAYVDGLVDRNGKKYQGYVSFEKGSGRFGFSFGNSINVNKGKKI